ncbi:MAG TPA: tRNA 5-methoxyuridine(34)/uridine 5-oxyacetic acid(34) synthase CmoB [Desulfobulbaceae bacterium]|nr:tRNA 5-methoxyuridine(34)/uridine 5-oxyacetic acid(34) synthase CmoB [Desulfobulbaceae bacterium]
MDYLDLLPTARHEDIARVLAEKERWLAQPKKGFLRYRELRETVRHIRAAWHDFSGDVVRIGAPEELAAKEKAQVQQVLRGCMPWRKGPFNVFGFDIDAEWRSERKWNRLLPEMPDLAGKLLADIGCNNGYYMFRMAHHQPRLALGFEPYVQHYSTFRILNSFAGLENLRNELLGIEHLHLFPDCFDVVFLLGIIYHRHSPLDALRDVLTALKPGGTLLLESQAIPGNQPMALFPEATYAKVPGTWFIPTAACLENWLKRTGFREIKMFCQHPMSSAEQRRTEWMIFESYEDFIDKDDAALTIEGYPAPWRVFFKARKR